MEYEFRWFYEGEGPAELQIRYRLVQIGTEESLSIDRVSTWSEWKLIPLVRGENNGTT